MINLYILIIYRIILIYSIDCYNSCLNCTELGDEKNHKCSECLNNYYFLENTYNCYPFNKIDKNYILFQNKLYKCDSRCKTCSDFPEKYSDNCIYCSKNYIKIQLFCIKYYNKYTINYLDKNLEYMYNESSPLEHSKYYSVVVYNYLETERINKYYNIGNISRLFIENCIEKIKIIYNKTDEELFIVKFDIIDNNFHLNNFVFDIFDNFFSTFDLNICYNESIIIQRPIINFSRINYSLAKNFSKNSINIYNENDDFFNNICFPFNYQKKSDVILKDRRKNFFQNISLCEEECIFKKINFNNDTINCECNINNLKNKKLENYGSIQSSNLLIKQFKNELYKSNFFIIKFYKLFFNIKYLKNNYGFFFQFILFVINIIIFLIYLKRYKISRIINCLTNIYKRNYYSFYFSCNNNLNNLSMSNVSNFLFLNDKNKKIIFSSNNNMNKSIHDFDNYIKEFCNNKTNEISYNNNQNLSSKINLKINAKKNNINKSDITQQIFLYKYKNKNKYKHKKKNQKEKNNFIFLYKKYLKQIHIIIKLFYINKLEITSIQIMNLLFIIALQNTITALFYDDQKISNIFYNEGNFSILEQIPKIIYSNLIIIFVNFFLLKLITSKKMFKKLLKQKYLFDVFMTKMKNIIRIFHIKINIFFVINFILFLFFIYYCSAFCAIYKYNQKIWLLNAFITFIFEIIYPFFLCIFFVLLKLFSIKIKSKWINSLNEIIISFF